MQQHLAIIGLAASVVVVAAILFSNLSSKDYSISVIASIDEGQGKYTGGLLTSTRLSIENTGKMPVTNISVKYIDWRTCQRQVQLDISEKERADLTNDFLYGDHTKVQEFIEKNLDKIDGVGMQSAGSQNNPSDLYFFKNIREQYAMGSDFVEVINPGDKVYLYPETGSYVLVTADNGISVTKSLGQEFGGSLSGDLVVDDPNC